MAGNTEGERSGSERLPELRRERVYCKASRLERQGGRRCIYTSQMPCLRGNRPEKLDLTYSRGLTARSVVLAKRTAPGRPTSRPKVTARPDVSFLWPRRRSSPLFPFA